MLKMAQTVPLIQRKKKDPSILLRQFTEGWTCSKCKDGKHWACNSKRCDCEKCRARFYPTLDRKGVAETGAGERLTVALHCNPEEL